MNAELGTRNAERAGKQRGLFDAVRFRFELITPELANKYLARTRGNRRLKDSTVQSYVREMLNGEWLTNHQGIAFDENDRLMDGHHRLNAIVQSGVSVLMLVSTGWPVKRAGAKSTTMDTVDRGCIRSLRDCLELQHGIPDARDTVQLTTALVNTLLGRVRRPKQTPGITLAVVDIYGPEIKWLCENISHQHGIRNSVSGAVFILGLAAWPEKTRAFYEQFKTGLNLTATNPIHHLRNYIVGGASFSAHEDRAKILNATAHHLELFATGKGCASLVCTSNAALNRLITANGERAKQVCALFGNKLDLDQSTEPPPPPSPNPPNSPPHRRRPSPWAQSSSVVSRPRMWPRGWTAG